HLPVGDPLAAGALTLFALGPGNRALHAAGDTCFGADRDVGLHPALPQRELTEPVGRAARTPDTILVVPHVAVGHCDGVDVGVDERRIPGHRIGHAVDVIPPSRVEAD